MSMCSGKSKFKFIKGGSSLHGGLFNTTADGILLLAS